MNKEKGVSLLAIILVIIGAAAVIGGGILVYQHYFLKPKLAVCTPKWTCGWGPCIIPPCAPGSNSIACTNGSQSQIAVDSNNCGLPASSAKIACPALARICTSSTQPSITITSPTNQTNWTIGKTYKINWQVKNAPSNSFAAIWVQGADGVGFVSTGSTPLGWTPANDLSANVTVPTSICGGGCGASVATEKNNPYKIYIRLMDSTGAENLADSTTGNIINVVSSTQPSITILSPNKGVVWKVGETHDITWKSSGVDKVTIWVGNANGAFSMSANDIADDIPASLGKYSWTIGEYNAWGDATAIQIVPTPSTIAPVGVTITVNP